ncbi:MAG: aspartate kinase [Simkaniaceae bacterium]|nr:aspartate kinase [Simkaniaceae bacterium]
MRILKFGGAAFARSKDFLHVAEIIKSWDEPVVVVVSAMYGVTDELLAMAREITSDPPKRELDMFVSVGERMTMALLAMALNGRGVSFTGSQSGIITTSDHTDALIIDVRPFRIQAVIEKGEIPIIAGFQGVSLEKEITTLGRGGSDTSAVALAIALGASGVTFYKDVGAIYTADPKTDPLASPISQLTYDQALKISGHEKGVLHPRCIALSQKNGLPLEIRSFTRCKDVGTTISGPAPLESEKHYERSDFPSFAAKL